MKQLVILSIAALMAVVCPAAQARTIDRGLGNPKSVYIPKGSWQFGLAGGYNNFTAGGLNNAQSATFLGLISDVKGNISFANASALTYYFAANNLGLGARFGFNYTGVNVDKASLMSMLDLSNQHTDVKTFAGSLAARYYIPLFNSKVFALFAEARLNGKIGYDKSYQQYEAGKTGTYADIYSISLGVYPGVCLFLTNNVAVELSLPLLEGGYEWDKQITNNEPAGLLGHTFVAFQPGLLGINLGITFSF